MAELNLSVVANRVLGLLHSEDVRKIGSLWGVPDELLRGLEGNISMLAPLLLDAEKRSVGDEQVREWLMRLGDELHDADNLLEDLSFAALRHSSMKKVRSFFSTLVSRDSRLEMRKKMQEIKIRLDEIATRVHAFRLEECSDKKIRLLSAEERKATIEEQWIFGREADREKLVMELLCDKPEVNITVLPIVGWGGTGKTTLAKLVFHDGRVQSRFDVWIWVSVSRNFDIKKILEDIVASATGRNRESHDMEMLQRLLRSSLEGKRYLIVLDDVWNEDSESWSSLMKHLKFGAKGSGILVTTRSNVVASIINPRRTFEIGVLSYEDIWMMLRRMASGQEISKNQMETGRCIARKTKGVPIIALAITGLLYFENSEAEWQFIYENEISRIVEARDDNYPALLKICYDHLPSPLKHCFAYCSLFPEDHEIDVQTLIKLWMAQGFIHPPSSSQSLEDVGYDYVLNLLSRSFFQDAQIDLRGRVTKCKMHDFMHSLAVDMAGEQCTRLSSEFSTDISMRRMYHLSFDFGLFSAERIPASLIKQEKMRSILLPSEFQREHRGRSDDAFYDRMISGFRLLRVLDMHAIGIKRVPRSISKLRHLKYLDLSGNEDITELPNSITKLLNLQTLRLSSCFRLEKWPRDIGKLVNLRHVENDGCYSLTSLPRGFGQLTNLQTLSQVILSDNASMRNAELNELKGLINLRKEIQIKNLGHGTGNHVAMCLNDIQKIRSLSLEWESRGPVYNDKAKTEDIDSNLFSSLEELALIGFGGETLFFAFSSNLVKLSLRRFAKCKSLPPFSQCLNLKVLVLDEMINLECVENQPTSSSEAFFPVLQELWLTELPNLQGWWRTISLENQDCLPSFPCLSALVIEDCPKLASMPLFPTLEGLVLDSTSWKPFQLTMKHKAKPAKEEASSSTFQSSPLSNLGKLCIVGIHQFDNLKAKEIAWNTFKNLELLKFDSLPEMKTLPKGLKLLTNLRELHVWRCGLKGIPAWITKLKALEKIVIRMCPDIKSLPKGISRVNLRTLEIEDCPVLLRRCEKETGVDWRKIARIPEKRLGWTSGK